ncbi:hypothetical protein ACFPYI_13740 [Halomarina salina]|uniref:Uncharacterized protein n=1 Tax=Halomarina salina TaxID=1872699 RepID=A0ABD5RPQ2_9EURY|nr:hypothetical protein [Halomarina salina]
MGNLTSLELGTGASVKVGDVVLIRERLSDSEDEANTKPGPREVDEIWFDDDEVPSGQAIIYLNHATIEDADRLATSPETLTDWLEEEKAYIGTPE